MVGHYAKLTIKGNFHVTNNINKIYLNNFSIILLPFPSPLRTNERLRYLMGE